MYCSGMYCTSNILSYLSPNRPPLPRPLQVTACPWTLLCVWCCGAAAIESPSLFARLTCAAGNGSGTTLDRGPAQQARALE